LGTVVLRGTDAGAAEVEGDAVLDGAVVALGASDVAVVV
jgi:hypothetical protein